MKSICLTGWGMLIFISYVLHQLGLRVIYNHQLGVLALLLERLNIQFWKSLIHSLVWAKMAVVELVETSHTVASLNLVETVLLTLM